MHKIRTNAFDDPVCLSVYSATRLRCVHSAERLDVFLGLETLGEPRNIVLDGSPDFRTDPMPPSRSYFGHLNKPYCWNGVAYCLALLVVLFEKSIVFVVLASIWIVYFLSFMIWNLYNCLCFISREQEAAWGSGATELPPPPTVRSWHLILHDVAYVLFYTDTWLHQKLGSLGMPVILAWRLRPFLWQDRWIRQIRFPAK